MRLSRGSYIIDIAPLNELIVICLRLIIVSNYETVILSELHGPFHRNISQN